jgi:hypothetical protein
LERLQGIIAAIWVARKVCLTHTRDEMFNASPVGNRASNRQKQDVAAGHEGVWQPVRLYLDLDIVC